MRVVTCCWSWPLVPKSCPRTTRCAAWTRKHTCGWAPFSPAEIRQLAESMAGPLPDEAIDVVRELSGGSPFMASAVLYGLFESRALVADRHGWRVEPLAIANLQSSSQAGSFLTHRLELLPKKTIELLSSGAVIGKEFDLAFAATLARQTPSQSIAALDEARLRHMVWVRANGFQCVFVHDKIREALLARLPADQRTELHRRAAAASAHACAAARVRSGLPLRRSGRQRQALPYALEAARQARARHALEIAEQQYRIAQRGTASASNAIRFQVVEGLGDVLMLRGRYDAAQELFEDATRLAEGRVAGAQILGKLGELSQKRGAIKRAIEYYEAALRELGQIIPRADILSLPLLARELWVQLLHTLFPRVFVHRRKRDPERHRTADRAPVQRADPGVLVRPQHLRHAVGASARDEPGRAVSAHAGIGARLFGTRAGHGRDLRVQPRTHLGLPARHDLRQEVAGHPQVVRRPVGTGSVAALLRHSAVHGIPVRGVHRRLPGGHPVARANRRLLGSPHGAVPDRRVAVSSGRHAGRD